MEEAPGTLESLVSKLSTIERLRLAVMILKKLPQDIQILMEAVDDPEVAKEVSEMAIQLIRIIPEMQKRVALEALKRAGIL